MNWPQTIDNRLFHWVNPALANPFLDWFMPFCSGNVFFAPVLVAACIGLVWKGGARGRLCVVMLVLAIALGDTFICNTIKQLVNRPRPFWVIPDAHVPAAIGRSDNGSMPSSHAANWFAATAVLFIYYRRSLRFMLPAALLVCFSRVYNGVHYPSDVLAGMILGAGYACAGVWTLDALWRWTGPRWFPLWHQQFPSLISPHNLNPNLNLNPSPSVAHQQWLNLGYCLIALQLVVQLIFLSGNKIDLAEDEAYQWLWSKHLALSYYSKPPLIAYTLFLGTWLWGDTPFGIHFFSPIISAVIQLCLLRFFARNVNARVGFWLSTLCPAVPLLALGNTLMTVDPLSVMFWTLAMLAGWRAVQRDTTRDWLWVGVWSGLGFLSKYTALFQWLCWAVFFALWPPARKQLRRPGPYLALLINALCAIPVLVWNSQHDWITVTHVAADGGLQHHWAFNPADLWHNFTRYTLDFVEIETLALNPFFVLPTAFAAFAFWKLRKNTPGLASHTKLQNLDSHSSTPSPPSEGGEGRGEVGQSLASPSATTNTSSRSPAVPSHSTPAAPLPLRPPRGERAGERWAVPSSAQNAMESIPNPTFPLMLFCFSMAAPIFLTYFFLTFHSRVLPNWIAPSILPFLALATIYWDQRWQAGFRRIKSWLTGGLILGGITVLLLHAPNLISKLAGRDLPPRWNPQRRLSGWKETAQAVDAARQKLLAEGKPVFIIGAHYGITSEVTFNLPEAKAGVPDHPLAYFQTSPAPENQFYFWPGYHDRKGQNAIFVQELGLPGADHEPPPAILKQEFDSITELGAVMITSHGRPIRRIQLTECRGLR